MTFNKGSDISSGKVSRRGRNAAIGGGGGILGILAVVIISQLTGVDLSGILGGGGGGGTASEEQLTCTAEQANTDDDCRVQGAAASIDDYWTDNATAFGIDYVTPPVVIFQGATQTGCGNATSAVGPFYCPGDQTIYLDTDFYATLRSEFGASGGELAQIYIIAHEWGHHIQNISGIMEGKDLRATGADSDSVRLELQADCFAGAWAGAATTTADADGNVFLQPFTDAQLADALNAAEAVGDDNIQEQTQGQATPESWTHGSSEQRQKWFLTGMKQGPDACATFDVSSAEL